MRVFLSVLAAIALPATAIEVVVDGETIGTTDKVTVTQGKITMTTGGQKESPEPEPAPEPDPQPYPSPVPSSCDNAPSDVICTARWEWPDGESRTPVTIPQGKTLSTPFRTTGNPDLRGKIMFEARSDTMPNTDIWISWTPGGSTYTAGTFNSFYCQQRDNAFMYSLRWYQNDSSRGCSLQTNTRYYFNIRHSSDDTPRSYTYRWRTYNQ